MVRRASRSILIYMKVATFQFTVYNSQFTFTGHRKLIIDNLLKIEDSKLKIAAEGGF